MKKSERGFWRKPSEVVHELENELWAVRQQVEKLKKMKSLNDVPDDFKEEVRVLFQMTSGKYLWEDE